MPSLAELTRRAVAVDGDFLALGHEVFDADGARFVRDRSLPRIYDANYVSDVRVATPDAVERLLARVDREYPHTRHRALQLDISTPPAVEAALVLRGYEHSASLVLLLEGTLQGAARAHDVRPIASEADWAAYARLKQRHWDERAERLGIRDASEVGADMFREHRAK